MTAMIEKAIRRLKTEKEQIEKLKKFKQNIENRNSKNPDEKIFLTADLFRAYGVDNASGSCVSLPYDLVNLLLPPEVLIPAANSLIEKLEKSVNELEGLLSVFEKAVKPVVAPE